MKIIILLSIFIATISFAKSFQESAIIENYKWTEDNKLYRLTIYGKAGVYWIDQKHLECISFSVKNNKQVRVTYDLKTLILSDCSTK